ncbi:MAG TPA: STAS domain-containing protein [Pirellulales bacterium]|nr:STAS domain-containing protein [Pirellulales bacterium]
MTRVSQVDGVTIFSVDREYDSLDDRKVAEFSAQLTAAIEPANPPLLLLDLSDTTFIGSSFLGVLVRAWKRIRERNGRMGLCCVNEICSEVLHASKLDTIWAIYPTRDAAVRALTAAGE